MTSCLDAALAYAERGWAVLPVIGKRPALKDWPTTASTGPDVVRRWWSAQPDRNVGLATGPRSGLAVIDVDPRSGGYESLCELEERVGVLPGTVLSLTGGDSGGFHFIYAHPGVKLTSRAHAFGEGIDVKADGGMIVAPPSVHPETGRAYAWLGGVFDGIVPWPAALLPPVAEPPRRQQRPPSCGQGTVAARRRLGGVLQQVVDAVEGERNTRLHWAACRCAEMVAAGELTEADATELLMRAAGAVGLGQIEAQETVRSGLRRAVAA